MKKEFENFEIVGGKVVVDVPEPEVKKYSIEDLIDTEIYDIVNDAIREYLDSENMDASEDDIDSITDELFNDKETDFNQMFTSALESARNGIKDLVDECMNDYCTEQEIAITLHRTYTYCTTVKTLPNKSAVDIGMEMAENGDIDWDYADYSEMDDEFYVDEV